MKLVSGLRTETDGDTCMISWDAAADDVWKAVDQAVTEWERKHRRSHGAKHGCGRCDKEGCGGCPLGRGGDAEKDARGPAAEEF